MLNWYYDIARYLINWREAYFTRGFVNLVALVKQLWLSCLIGSKTRVNISHWYTWPLYLTCISPSASPERRGTGPRLVAATSSRLHAEGLHSRYHLALIKDPSSHQHWGIYSQWIQQAGDNFHFQLSPTQRSIQIDAKSSKRPIWCQRKVVGEATKGWDWGDRTLRGRLDIDRPHKGATLLIWDARNISRKVHM